MRRRKKIDFDKVDVFGWSKTSWIWVEENLSSVNSVSRIGPTLMTLRHELHLLAHRLPVAIAKILIAWVSTLTHLAFYYHKYFKKTLSTKFFGVESSKEVIDLVRDCVVVNPKNQVVEAQLPEDMESHGIFVMLTRGVAKRRQRPNRSGVMSRQS